MTPTPAPLLTIRNLCVHFDTPGGVGRAVDGVSLAVGTGQTAALVGESGCGKTTVGNSITALLPPAARVAAGSVELDGRELLTLGPRQMRAVRGRQIGMIFQEPASSLNPVLTVGRQIVEAIRLHRSETGRQARALAAELMERVGVPSRANFSAYPHQLSGGMQQRIMLAAAISCGPKLLIADEPTSALDVTVQSHVLDLLADLQAGGDMSILLITHDLAVVAGRADVVAVMYAGRLVELSDKPSLLAGPMHPYTQALLNCQPRLDRHVERLAVIPGAAPSPTDYPQGCRFHPRCPVGSHKQRCRQQAPDLGEAADGHWVACWECGGYHDAEATDPSQHVLGIPHPAADPPTQRGRSNLADPS
ncbi:MAG: ABC transporter ATP-binding protein [Planctomycetota bacterium]|jgi:oligopeptide/dipeptide ABC transporter ATP-binding protein